MSTTKATPPKVAATNPDQINSADIITHLQHDGPIDVAVGKSLTDTNWKSGFVSLAQFFTRLSRVKRTDVKGASGGYVLGRLRAGNRTNANLAHLSGLRLDYDHIRDVEELWNAVLRLNCSACLHTTHRHTADHPRARVIIPLAHSVSAGAFGIISHAAADRIGMDGLDKTTHEAVRLMFWPTAPEGGEFIFRYHDAPWLNPDDYAGYVPDNPDRHTHSTQAAERNDLVRIALGVGSGERNQAAARMAGYLFRYLPDAEVALATLEAWNLTNDPPLSIRELHTVANSIAKRQARKEAARYR